MTTVSSVHAPSFNFSSALSSNSEGYIDSSEEEEPIMSSPTSPQVHKQFASRTHSQKHSAPKLPPIPPRLPKRSASNDSSSGSGLKYPFVKAFMLAAQKLLPQQSRRQKKSPVHPPSFMTVRPVEKCTNETNVSDYEDSSDGDDARDTTKHIVHSADDQLQKLYRPHGRWAAYFNQPIENAKVVANLGEGAMCEVYLKTGVLGGQHITYISKTWVLSRTWNGFFSEIALYADPRYLRDLQGDVVPHLIGVYLVEGRISVAMELPSSAFWVEASEDMPNHLKEKCIAAFDKIHARGVLHNDVELRHMLINAEGNVTIIDFQGSQAVKPDEIRLIEPCTEDVIRLEKRKVKFKLKYQNAARYESTKRVRVLSKEDRNRKRRELQALKGVGDGDCLMEAHDPDDIINPIVEPQVWTDLWLGQDSEPRCFVVPGQDYETIQHQLRMFVWTHCIRDHGPPPPPPPKRRRVVRRGRIIYSAASDAGSTRKRKFSESGSPIALPTVTPSPSPTKKCRVNSSVAVTRSSSGRSPSQLGPALVPTAETYRPLTNAALLSYCLTAKGAKEESQHTPVPNLTDSNVGRAEERSISALSELSPTAKPRIPLGSSSQPSSPSSQASYDALSARPDFIHVPYEGYDRPGGFVAPNNFTESQLSMQRRTWIRQNNISRCWDLHYPLAELLGLTPSTDGSGGLKRRGVLQSMGSLKRAREGELDTPWKKSRTDDRSPSPSSSRLPEGPRVISQDEFRSLTEAPATCRPRRRGILKRILTEAEKEAQRSFERRRPAQKDFGVSLLPGHGRHSPSASTTRDETRLNSWLQKVRREAAPLPIECPDPELVRPKAPFRAHSVPWGANGSRPKCEIRRFDIGARRYAVAVKLSRESISGSISGSPYHASHTCELLGSRSERHCGGQYLRSQSEPPQGSYTVDFIERTALRSVDRASVEGKVVVRDPYEMSSVGVMGSLRLMAASLLPTRWL